MSIRKTILITDDAEARLRALCGKHDIQQGPLIEALIMHTGDQALEQAIAQHRASRGVSKAQEKRLRGQLLNQNPETLKKIVELAQQQGLLKQLQDGDNDGEDQ